MIIELKVTPSPEFLAALGALADAGQAQAAAIHALTVRNAAPAPAAEAPAADAPAAEAPAAEVKRRGRPKKAAPVNAAPTREDLAEIIAEAIDQGTTEAENAALADEPTVPTIDEARDALQRFTQSKGMPAGIDLLKAFGAARISDLTDGQRATIVDDINKQLAE